MGYHMNDADRILQYLCEKVDAARARGEGAIAFKSGDVTRDVGVAYYRPASRALWGPEFRKAASVQLLCQTGTRGANYFVMFKILKEPRK